MSLLMKAVSKERKKYHDYLFNQEWKDVADYASTSITRPKISIDLVQNTD